MSECFSSEKTNRHRFTAPMVYPPRTRPERTECSLSNGDLNLSLEPPMLIGPTIKVPLDDLHSRRR